MAAANSHVFHWLDYVIFAASLVMGLVIGVYYSFAGKRQKSTEDFLMGGRKVSVIPMALSIEATLLSAIIILGGTAEIYSFGTMMFTWTLSDVISLPLLVLIFVPFFRRNPYAVSGYEYLQLRYNRVVRLAVSASFCIQSLLYMAVALYAPSLAFSQVTGLSMWVSLFTTGVVCTIYTAMGGMKAVVWTDSVQMLILIAGLVTLIIKGMIACGGLSNVLNTANNGGRIEFSRYDAWPSTRHSLWTQTFGGAVFTLSLYAGGQTFIQRYLCMKSTRDANTAVIVSRVNTALTYALVAVCGLVMYTYFAGCDPLTTKTIQNRNQMVLLFMMDILGDYHGLPGLFTASIFAAALSTVSSGVNSLAAVLLEDFIRPVYVTVRQRPMTDSQATWLSKALAVMFGALSIGLGYAVGTFGRTVLQISMSIAGAGASPNFAMFFMGILMPFINSWGALAGLVSGTLTASWVAVGAMMYVPPPPPLLTSTALCPPSALLNTSSIVFNTSASHSTSTAATTTLLVMNNVTWSAASGVTSPSYPAIYSLSYMWYGPLAFSTALLVATVVSLATGCNKNKQIDSVWSLSGNWRVEHCTSANSDIKIASDNDLILERTAKIVNRNVYK